MEFRAVKLEYQGANKRSKRIFKTRIRAQRIDLFCHQETKMQEMSKEIVKRLGLGRFLKWEVLDIVGTAAGVLVGWDMRCLELWSAWEVGPFQFHVNSET